MKITIVRAFPGTPLSVDATPVQVQGLPCAYHRSVTSPSKWSLTHVPTGVCLGTGNTRSAAAAEFEKRITGHTIEEVVAKLATSPPAPPPDSVPAYLQEVKPAAPVVGVQAIADEICRIAGVADARGQKAVRAALCGHGKNAGRLLATSPSSWKNEFAAAAWHGLQPNAFKVGIGVLMMLSGDARELYGKLAAHRWPDWLDKDKASLVALGVW